MKAVTLGRRVVTGQSDDGRSLIASDGSTSSIIVFEQLAKSSYEGLFEVPLPLTNAADGGEPAAPMPYVPPAGHARFMRLVVPPDSEIARADLMAALREGQEKAPDFLRSMDPSRGRGMHRTDSVDFVVIFSGRLVLVTENGETEVRAGDSVVQRGTWHAWRNPGDEPCVMFTVMLRTSAES